MAERRTGKKSIPMQVTKSLRKWVEEKRARLRTVTTPSGIVIKGDANKSLHEELTKLAENHGLKLEVKFRRRMSVLQVEFDPLEEMRIRRAAGMLGISQNAYLRLCETYFTPRFLGIWQSIIDDRAHEFVKSRLGVHTQRLGLTEKGGLSRAQNRLLRLRVTTADALKAIHPSYELRPNWMMPSFEGDFYEQALAATALLEEDDRKTKEAIKEIELRLVDTFLGSVEKYREYWLSLTRLREQVRKKFLEQNQDLVEGFKRDIAFIDQSLDDLKKNRAFGYRRWRVLGSESSDIKYPNGRGYARWRPDLVTAVGGLMIFREAVRVKLHDKREQASTRRNILMQGLAQWRRVRVRDLKGAEQRLGNDMKRLELITANDDVWYNPERLLRLLADDPRPASINKPDVYVGFPPKRMPLVNSTIKIRQDSDQ